MATTTSVSSDDHLRASFQPVVEYIDGEWKERAMVASAHGLIRSLLSAWFFSHEDEWKVRAGVEIPTQVSPTRVRLPEGVVDRAYKWPQVLTEPPLIVIEVLSPTTPTRNQKLATDYQNMGVPNIWSIDPETKTGRVCEGPLWKEVKRLEVEGREVHLDLEWLFSRLARYDAE